ncbi:MAG: accessory gene regulator ArgB-like protein [Romboutsia sp.]|uniref:accessory gene regulator ArgB-like protein n=1 Tax=Romboutsia sp. TaxID=1965302 RepID=UPI003F30471F
MIKSLSYKFTNILVNNDIIENEDFEIYRYGFETLIYFIVNIAVALFIGIIFDRFMHTIVFLSCYCTLRQFTGGYHARNYTECTLTFVVIYLITIFVSNNIDIDKYKYLLILVMIICTIIIYKLAPLEHRNKPLSKDEKKQYRKIAMRILSIILICFVSSIVLNDFVEYIIYSVFAVVCITILLIIGHYIKAI